MKNKNDGDKIIQIRTNASDRKNLEKAMKVVGATTMSAGYRSSAGLVAKLQKYLNKDGSLTVFQNEQKTTLLFF